MMINIFSEWVRSVTIILLLALFLDMLIPNSSLKRYVRVVIGLFIILIVLTPLIKILNDETYENLSVFNLEQKIVNGKIPELDEILKEGEEIQSVGTKQAQSILEGKIAYQIEGLCSVVEGVERVKAKVKINDNHKLGEIEKIDHILLEVAIKGANKNNDNDSSSTVTPIIIGEQKDEERPIAIETKNKEIGTKLRSIVSSFYGIEKSKIEIDFTK